MASREIYATTFDEDEQQTDQNTCPECDGRVTTNTHETVCENCGLVLDDEQIDPGPEWREFPDDRTNERRVGSPNTVARHDQGIGSQIGWDKDSNGRLVSERKRRQLHRLRREQNRARAGTTAEQNQITGLTEIRRMASALGLAKSIRDQACKLFKSAQGENLLRGWSVEAFASACLYAVCRLNRQPRPIGEVASVSKVPEDRVTHCFTVLNRSLELPVPPAGPTQYLPQIASAVDASHETERRARALLERADDQQVIQGRHPMGVAAGALYLAGRQTGEFITQGILAEASEVSEMTIRKRYCELKSVTV
jgi:transcription initiation factor TFIIB